MLIGVANILADWTMKVIPLFVLLLAGGVIALNAADVSVYAITKTQGFTQASTTAPTPLVTGGFTFASVITRTTTTPSRRPVTTAATTQQPSRRDRSRGP